MQHDFDLFLSIAEIAGVFVGFGALIAVTHGPDAEREDLFRMAGVVGVGVYTIVGALIPVALGRFGLVPALLWRWSGAAYLFVAWLGILPVIRIPEIRAFVGEDARARPVFAFIFWVFLETPAQLALLLVVLGLFPTLAPALYTMALVLGAFEAAMVLSQIVYSRLLRA